MYNNREINLERRSLENVLPSHFIRDYPDFVKFLEVYLQFVDTSAGLDGIIEALKTIRNVDLSKETYQELMKSEFGNSFPDNTTMTDANALKIFKHWFQSKGSQNAIEAYFRLFLNADAEIIYPKDNILRVSDGNWNDIDKRYVDGQGLLSETTMVVQDSTFYQIFSYLVKSDISISDWGPLYTQLAHPAGWNLFGEVLITELAKFEYQTKSPTIVPGFQTRDSNLLILGAALYFAVGEFETSSAPKRDIAWKQYIKKYWDVFDTQIDYNLNQAKKNIISSTHSVRSLHSYFITDFNNETSKGFKYSRVRPARIIIR